MSNSYTVQGGVNVDDRGAVRFVNSFDMAAVRRFYQVENHAPGFVRAWHGHRHEAKYAYVVRGTARIATMPMSKYGQNEYENIYDGLQSFVLSDKNPQVLVIPPGHWNGVQTLEADTVVMFFSTKTLLESKGDDYRMGIDPTKGV